MSTDRPTLLMIDDHQLVGMATSHALRREGFDAHWLSSVGSDLVDVVRGFDPQVVLLDLDLGRDEAGLPVDGVTLVRPLSAAGWPVIIVSGTRHERRLAAAVSEGAIGWVDKTAPFPQLLAACQAAVRGEAVIAPHLRRAMVARHESSAPDSGSDARSRLEALTRREREVLAHLADGVRVADIARQSGVSVSTVRSQVKAIRSKLAVRSQLEAAALYRASHT